MVLPLKLYMGNASGSQSFVVKPGSKTADAHILAVCVDELVRNATDTTWVLGEASEVEDGVDYAGDARADEILSAVQAWVA